MAKALSPHTFWFEKLVAQHLEINRFPLFFILLRLQTLLSSSILPRTPPPTPFLSLPPTPLHSDAAGASFHSDLLFTVS